MAVSVVSSVGAAEASAEAAGVADSVSPVPSVPSVADCVPSSCRILMCRYGEWAETARRRVRRVKRKRGLVAIMIVGGGYAGEAIDMGLRCKRRAIYNWDYKKSRLTRRYVVWCGVVR